MSVCPECGREIDHLINVCSAWKIYRFFVDGDDYDYEHIEDIPYDETNEYQCPECNEVLFYDETKAMEFLKKK